MTTGVEIPAVFNNRRITKPLDSLLKGLLFSDPKKRFTVEQFSEHEFLKDFEAKKFIVEKQGDDDKENDKENDKEKDNPDDEIILIGPEEPANQKHPGDWLDTYPLHYYYQPEERLVELDSEDEAERESIMDSWEFYEAYKRQEGNYVDGMYFEDADAYNDYAYEVNAELFGGN